MKRKGYVWKTFPGNAIAANDDQIVYFGTPYRVWEHPVLADAPAEAPGSITVTDVTPTYLPLILKGSP